MFSIMCFLGNLLTLAQSYNCKNYKWLIPPKTDDNLTELKESQFLCIFYIIYSTVYDTVGHAILITNNNFPIVTTEWF